MILLRTKYLMPALLLVLSGHVSAANPIECLLQVIVAPSTQFAEPTTQYTRIKNDSSPMLLIGIEIHSAQAAFKSKKIKSHQQYCSSLIGQRKDAYLSGHFDMRDLQIKLGDKLDLKNIHSSEKQYPFWADFYFQIKSE